MAKSKQAAKERDRAPHSKERPDRAAPAGGGPGGGIDPEQLLEQFLAVAEADLKRVKGLADKADRALTLDESRMVASYVRSLSALVRERRKSNAKDGLGDKSTEELLELAMSIPELRDLLEARR